jgi:hypothetical protein
MATPTIIIGIGTSGLRTLENAHRFYYETIGKKAGLKKPKNVEFIYIETNENNHPEGSDWDEYITRVYISLDNMAEMIAELKNSCENPSWLPDSGEVLSAGMGAGGIRSCGRLAMWGRNQKGNNFGSVISVISNAYAKVMHISNNDTNVATQPVVFVTGSLTGGTGAGIFIDLGYLVRHLIQNVKDLYGLFLLPKEPTDIRDAEVMYGNAYGAIKDLEYYNQIQNKYSEKWPNGFTKDEQIPPYELVQFISQDYQNGAPAISTLSGLYKMAGLYLFLNIAGIYEKRKERLVDAAGNNLIGKYGTFGLSAIQFPKDQIQEFISSQLGIELIQRLTDNEWYFLNGQKRKITRASIKQNMAIEFDTILESGFDSLNVMGDGKNLLVGIDNDSTRINKGEIKGNPVEYIISMFTSSRNDNYHALVSNNIKSALNVFVDSIYQQVDNAMQSTENLYYAKYVLEDIVECIERTLAYWKSIGVSSQPEKWDNELRKLAIGCTSNTYKSVFEHDSVLKDRLNTIFELMKMSLSIRVLVDIVKHVKEGQIKLQGGNHELPRIKMFSEIINKLTALIGNTDEENGNTSFTRRLNDIKGDINDTTLPILRVYPSNSFTKECEIAREVYNQKNGSPVRSMSDIIGQQNILSYFRQGTNVKFQELVYIDFLREYRLKVDSLHCIEDFDIANYILEHTSESVQTAKNANSPFLKTKTIFSSDSKYIPRFIIGDDNNELIQIQTIFKNQNYEAFKDTDGRIEIGDMKNIIVFYDEKGNYVPLNELSYISLMKSAYENVPPNLADKTVTSERWKNNRSAYPTK